MLAGFLIRSASSSFAGKTKASIIKTNAKKIPTNTARMTFSLCSFTILIYFIETI